MFLMHIYIYVYNYVGVYIHRKVKKERKRITFSELFEEEKKSQESY